MTETVETMVLELTDRRATGWVLDGSEESGMPLQLDTSSSTCIKARSVVKSVKEVDGKDTIVFRPIRYIKGCTTIFVDEQEKMGVKPNPQVDLQDLYFINGTKTVTNKPGEKSLFDYLKNYEGNEDNKNRPDSARVCFRELKSKEIAESSITDFDADLEARNYLKKLKTGERNGSVQYKKKEIDFLCTLFNLPYLANYPEKFNSLIAIAVANPVKFNESVANAKSGMLADINLSIKLGVVKLDSTKAVLTQNNSVLASFSSSKTQDQLEELASFFLSESGEMSYRQFEIELKAAKERAVVMEK